jgi:hypothetical protein
MLPCSFVKMLLNFYGFSAPVFTLFFKLPFKKNILFLYFQFFPTSKLVQMVYYGSRLFEGLADQVNIPLYQVSNFRIELKCISFFTCLFEGKLHNEPVFWYFGWSDSAFIHKTMPR